MKKITGCLLVLLICSAGAITKNNPANAPRSSLDDSLQLIVPDDLTAELWAESPAFYNPTNIDVDSRGRLWVTEAANYRNFNNDSTKFLHHSKGDRVMILEDTDGDGKSDKSTLFVEDRDLVSPLGIAVIGNKVIVLCAPNVIIYTDENHDDKPDKKEIFLTGFGGLDHDHSLHSMIAGPDGKWYFNTGNAGPHMVKDSAGWMLRSGSIYTGGTPYNKVNKGGMVSDDGKVWVGGLALRIDPNGKGLKVMGHNFRNAYELALDSYGNMWQNDNDDQVVTCRTTFLMEGGNAGYFSSDGTRFWQADRRPGQSTFTAHWHQDDPGVIPAGDNTGAGSPTGIVVNESDALGPQYRGMLLSADAGRNTIFSYKPEITGAGFLLKRNNLITSIPGDNEAYVWNDTSHLHDHRKWFRPSDVAIGTDGAIYVADWYDPIIGGHQMKDQTGYGRIYRITPKNKKLSAPKVDVSTVTGQVDALKNPAINVRNLGFSKLVAAGASSVEPVSKLLDDENPYVQARAVWLLAQLGAKGLAVVEKNLANKNPDIRVTAYRALKQIKPDIIPYANQLVNDPSAAVRREVAISLRDMPLSKSQPVIMKLAKTYEGNDRWLLEALGNSLDGKQDAIYPLLKTAMGSATPAKWSQSFADLTWRLHPLSATESLKTRAASQELSEAEREKALVALAFIKNKKAADAMTSLASNSNKAIGSQATWWLNFRKTNDWLDILGGNVKNDNLSIVSDAVQKKMAAQRDKLLDEKTPLKEKQKLATDMAGSSVGGQMLIDLAASKKLSKEVVAATSQVIFKNPDQGIRVQASNYFQRPGVDKIFSIQAISKMQPEAASGKAVFAGTCAACHKAGAVGNDLGPELTAIGKKYDRVSLLDAIINPSASIVFGYEPWLIKTKDGGSVYGFIIGDGQTVVVKDAARQQHVIKSGDIVSRKKMDQSMMPDPTSMGLDEKKLADVAEYLLSLK